MTYLGVRCGCKLGEFICDKPAAHDIPGPRKHKDSVKGKRWTDLDVLDWKQKEKGMDRLITFHNSNGEIIDVLYGTSWLGEPTADELSEIVVEWEVGSREL